jgi:PKHD-type hydroxylase
MVHSTEPKGLSVELPKINNISEIRGGGGWPLVNDPVENFAWCREIFNRAELDAIIKIGTAQELAKATTYGGQDNKVRNSFVNFLFPNEINSWVFARLAGAINEINNAFFGFDLFGMEQGLQFTKYEAPGEHYEWHIDRGIHTGTRKLSLAMQLSDPEDYEGGDLEMWFGGEPTKASRDRGLITFFPSYVMHRVTPVTKGTRYSLVCWVSGPPFK